MDYKTPLFFISIFFIFTGCATAISQFDYDFDKHIDDISSNNFTIHNITLLGAAPYEDILGNIFWGVVFALTFGIMWISMEDITIPALLGMIIGGSIWALMPQDWLQMAQSLTVISLAGLIYSLLKKE